jgi:threonine/homoserine/homoserine lactone efflux protein
MSTAFVALLVFAFAAATTPGPSNLLASASGANFGYRRTIPFILGSIAGLPLLIVAIGLGLGQLLKVYPALHEVLKWGGSAYLLYLAWRIATAGRPQGDAGAGRPLTFLQAAAFQWINPKGWLAAASALGAFTTDPQRYVRDTLLVAGVFFVCFLLATNVWCLFGTAMGRLLASRRALAWFNGFMSLLIVASIALLYL